MDFQPQMKLTFPTGIPIPFFLAYPGYLSAMQIGQSPDPAPARDFEYLQRTYPAKVRAYRRRVEEILDRIDYEGSMIYDEYPDSVSLQSLGRMVERILKNENGMSEDQPEDDTFAGLIQVLVCNEVFRRRQKPRG